MVNLLIANFLQLSFRVQRLRNPNTNIPAKISQQKYLNKGTQFKTGSPYMVRKLPVEFINAF